MDLLWLEMHLRKTESLRSRVKDSVYDMKTEHCTFKYGCNASHWTLRSTLILKTNDPLDLSALTPSRSLWRRRPCRASGCRPAASCSSGIPSRRMTRAKRTKAGRRSASPPITSLTTPSAAWASLRPSSPPRLRHSPVHPRPPRLVSGASPQGAPPPDSAVF